MTTPKVLISLLTDEDTKQTEFCNAFLELLFSTKSVCPEFVNNFEPINVPVKSVEDALAYWPEYPFYWRRKHKIVSQGDVFHTGVYGSGAILLRAKYDRSFDWLGLFRQLVLETKAHYAYLHLITDVERDRTLLNADDAYDFFLGAFTKTVEHGFKELAWANYFGSRWDAEIDYAKLTKTWARVESISDGRLVAVTENLGDVETDYSRFEAVRQRAKESFRTGFFRPT